MATVSCVRSKGQRSMTYCYEAGYAYTLLVKCAAARQ